MRLRLTSTTSRLLFTFVIMASICAIQLVSSPKVSAYEGSNLIDNTVFLDAKSMNASQIQTFLSNIGGGLANKKFVLDCALLGDKTSSLYRSIGAPCGSSVNAGQIIYYSSQVYGVSPRVIIATLQKEQGLITNPSPGSWEINQAMGYGCPTSGHCDDDSGFFWQIDNGTWALRFHYERARKNNSWWYESSWTCGTAKVNYYSPSLYPKQNVQFYDGDGVQYRTYMLANAATSAMYCYTPHAYNNFPGCKPAWGVSYASWKPTVGSKGMCYSGSYNFVVAFESWFGSTQFPQPTGGALYRQSSNGKIYLVANEKRFYIPSPSVMANYSLTRFGTMSANDTTINNFADGGTLSNLITSDGKVYLVNNGYKHHVTGTTVCTNWDFSCFNTNIVKSLGSEFTNVFLKTGSSLNSTASYDGDYYEMLDGKKYPFADKSSFTSSGNSTAATIKVNSGNFDYPLGTLRLKTPGVIKFSPKSTLYYFDGSNYHSISSMDVYQSWDLDKVHAINAPSSSYNTSATVPSQDLSYWAKDSSNNSYLVNDGGKLPLNTMQQALWPSANYSSGLDSLLASRPTKQLGAFIKSGIHYYKLDLNTSRKQYIAGMADFRELGGTSHNTTYLSSALVETIPSGPFAFADGRLIKVQGDTTIYVMNKAKLSHVASMSVLRAYSFNTSNMKTYPVAGISEYTRGDVLRDGLTSSGTAYLMNGSSLLKLSSDQVAASGLKTDGIADISQQLVSRAKPKTATSIIRDSGNGKIYFVNGGSLRYISSPSKLSQVGKNTPVTNVTPRIIALFTIDNPL